MLPSRFFHLYYAKRRENVSRIRSLRRLPLVELDHELAEDTDRAYVAVVQDDSGAVIFRSATLRSCRANMPTGSVPPPGSTRRQIGRAHV